MIILGIIILILLFFYFFYPQQSMPLGSRVFIQTPEFEKYRNDCLHPCVRYIAEGFNGSNWWMVQSPYYGRNSQVENPILYKSNEKRYPMKWKFVSLVQDTPKTGFNSDPMLFYEKKKLWVFWREYDTPLCNSLNVSMATVGCFTSDGKNFSSIIVYLTQKGNDRDTEQCPILIKKNGIYIFYAVHYEYEPMRKNLGIAIWEGTSLEQPNFVLKKTIPFPVKHTCDKFKQFRLGKQLLFIPKPLKHDVWHFDLFEYKNKLYMFSVAEWGDNIMLSVANDNANFKTFRKPLVNSHYSESSINYRSYYYKPTGFIENDTIYLNYTSRGKVDKNANELFFSKCKLPKRYI
jgi:hypothetical protein